MQRVPFALCCSLLLTLLGPALARAQSTPPIIVVAIESGHGLPSAEVLRATLAQALGVRVVLATEVAEGSARPDALLSITVDARRKVSVLYWDRTGQPDALSAPAVAPRDRIDTVVMTLAAALLQRHLGDLVRVNPPQDIDIRAVREGHARALWTSQELYTALTRMGLLQRRTAALSFEDF